MRFTTLLILSSACVGALAAASGCGSSSNNGTGAGTTTTSSSSSGKSSTSTSGGTSTSSSSSGKSSTSSSSSGIGTGGGGTGGNGTGGTAPQESFVCGSIDGGATTLPATPPSGGACVTVPADDAGVELDAGVNDAGKASRTTCNPITNAGCTGTDTCYVDSSNTYYYCQPVGTMPNIVPCGDCTGAQQYCKFGGLCVGTSTTSNAAVCTQMCCTNADCGPNATCATGTTALQTALPSNVGICITP